MRQEVSFITVGATTFDYESGNTDIDNISIETDYCEVVNQGSEVMNLLYGGFKQHAYTVYCLRSIPCNSLMIGTHEYQIDRVRTVDRDTIYNVSRV